MNKETIKKKYDRHFGIEPNDDELDFYYTLLQQAKDEDNWISVEDVKNLSIKRNQRVLTFSPIYKQSHNEMRYRLMNYSFVSMCKEITHIQIPKPPKQ